MPTQEQEYYTMLDLKSNICDELLKLVTISPNENHQISMVIFWKRF